MLSSKGFSLANSNSSSSSSSLYLSFRYLQYDLNYILAAKVRVLVRRATNDFGNRNKNINIDFFVKKNLCTEKY